MIGCDGLINYTGFISYVILAAFSPGPNNIMAMTNAAKYGLKRGLIFCFGMLCGFIVTVSCCTLFSVMLFDFIPVAEPVMKYVGAAYILWLAYSICADKPQSEKKPAFRTDGTLAGMMLQLVNVKVMIFSLTAVSMFVLPHSKEPRVLALTALLLVCMCSTSNICWAMFGSLFQRVINAHRKVANAVMALLLVYCAATLFM